MMKRFSGHFVISLNQHSKGVYVPGLIVTIQQPTVQRWKQNPMFSSHRCPGISPLRRTTPLNQQGGPVVQEETNGNMSFTH